jgi:hypothetical protein
MEFLLVQLPIAGLPELFDPATQHRIEAEKSRATGVLFPSGEALLVQMEQFADAVHPLQNPRLLIVPATLEVEEIASHMSPAKGQQQVSLKRAPTPRHRSGLWEQVSPVRAR